MGSTVKVLLTCKHRGSIVIIVEHIIFPGLNVDDNPDKQKKKEQKWVNNFQKHAFLSDGVGGDHDEKNKTTSKSASYSPGKLRTSYSAGSTRHEKRKADSEEQNRNTRSKCFDPSVSPEDLLMLGLYRLDEEQEDIYRRFVDMISTFDDFDKVRQSYHILLT